MTNDTTTKPRQRPCIPAPATTPADRAEEAMPSGPSSLASFGAVGQPRIRLPGILSLIDGEGETFH